MVHVSFVLQILGVHLHDRAANVTRLGIPRNVITDLECIDHVAIPPGLRRREYRRFAVPRSELGSAWRVLHRGANFKHRQLPVESALIPGNGLSGPEAD